uniref:ANK_REP_REGION domain-containing protein n=1 Tax=Mesocestoides corti TaxID=53468 RepID=A0A5K3FA55_MESCO
MSSSPQASPLTSGNVTLRKSAALRNSNWLDVQSARLTSDGYEISENERIWRTAVIKGDFAEISKLLSAHPELANWRDYITGVRRPCTSPRKSTTWAWCDSSPATTTPTWRSKTTGQTPLHMAALGASEDVAFLLMSQFNAKATARDYSGRLPVSYVPENEAGNRLKSLLRAQYAKMLQNLPLCHKSQSPEDVNRDSIVSRDDLPPTKPMRISGFASLRRRRVPIGEVRQLSGEAVVPDSNFANMIYSSVRLRKSARGKNYNPMDPEYQKTSFQGRSPTSNNSNREQQDGQSPTTPEVRLRAPRN